MNDHGASQFNQLLPNAETRARVGNPPKSTFYDWINNLGFPKPIKVGNRSFWVEREVDAWISEQIAANRPAKVA